MGTGEEWVHREMKIRGQERGGTHRDENKGTGEGWVHREMKIWGQERGVYC